MTIRRTCSSSSDSSSYNNLLTYFTDLNKVELDAPASLATPTYSQAFGPLGFEFSTNDYAFFAQDDWKVSQRLSLSLGLRWEYEQLPDPYSAAWSIPTVPQTATMPSDKNNFGPRVGFAYDIFGNGKTVVRGGYGLYYGRVINSTIFNALSNTGACQAASCPSA